MSIPVLDNLDLNGNQLLNAVVQQLGTDPGTPVEGQVWENTTSHKIKAFLNGSIVIVRDTGTPITDSDVAAANKDGVAGTASMRTIGTGAAQAMAGNTRLDTIAAPTADVGFNGHKATGAADGTAATDLVTLQQVNALVAGIDIKGSVKAASTANVTVSNPGTAVFDGITLTNGDRLLLKDQTTPSQNGIYTFNGSGSALTRTTDFDAWTEIPGSLVAIEQGTAQADRVYLATADQGGTIGTTSITFSWFNPPASGIAKFSGTITGDGSTTQFTVTHNLGSTDVSVSVIDISADLEVLVDRKRPTTNTARIDFAQAPAVSKAYRVVVLG